MSMARRLRQPTPPPITHRATIDRQWHKQGLVVEAGWCIKLKSCNHRAMETIEAEESGEDTE